MIYSGRKIGGSKNSRKYTSGHESLPKTVEVEIEELDVQEPWLTEIINGKKTIEGRVGHIGKYDKWIGKEIYVFDPKIPSNRTKVTVKNIKHYDTLEEFIKGSGWKNVAPHMRNEESTIKAYLDVKMDDLTDPSNPKKIGVFSSERIKERGGINALEIVLSKNSEDANQHSPNKLIFINGPSGVGKTTIGKLLKDKLPDSILIDQDTYFKKEKPTVEFQDDKGKEYKCPNWDTLESIDFDKFNAEIESSLKLPDGSANLKNKYVIVTGFALHLDKMSQKPDVNILLVFSNPEDSENIKKNMIDARRMSKGYTGEKAERDRWMVTRVTYPFYEETLTKLGETHKIAVFEKNVRRPKDVILSEILKLVE